MRWICFDGTTRTQRMGLRSRATSVLGSWLLLCYCVCILIVSVWRSYVSSNGILLVCIFVWRRQTSVFESFLCFCNVSAMLLCGILCDVLRWTLHRRSALPAWLSSAVHSVQKQLGKCCFCIFVSFLLSLTLLSVLCTVHKLLRWTFTAYYNSFVRLEKIPGGHRGPAYAIAVHSSILAWKKVKKHR